MKRLILSFLLLLLLSIQNVYPQSGWVWQNPLPQGNTLNNVYFTNESTGFALGAKGVILSTTDSGNSWNTFYLNSNGNLNAINCLDNLHVIVVGDSSKIFRTSNGGNNWHSVVYPGNYKFKDTKSLSLDYCIIAGSNIVLKSTNAGVNWTNLITLGSNYDLRKILIADSNNVFVVGSKFTGGFPPNFVGIVMKTTNAGNNWYETTLNSSGLNSIFLVSLDNIICVGVWGVESVVFKSTNMGANWYNKISSTFVTLNDIVFFDANTGITIGTDGNGRILKTVNGGENWSSNLTNGFDLLSCAKVSNNAAFIVGENGVILKSNNVGLSWSLITHVLQSYGKFNKVQFLNENTGTIVGIGYDFPTYQGGSILRTTNRGETWESQRCYTISPGNISDLFFTSENTGFVIGGSGFFSKTTNGGTNWSCNVIGSVDLKSIWFTDFLNGSIVGSYGYVYKTTNSGSSWFLQYNNNNFNLNGVHFINNNTGTAVGSAQGGAILHTTNGGNTWFQQYIGASNYYNLYDVFLIDANIGFILAESGTVYKTTNAGTNWSINISFYNYSLNEIKFINNFTGFVAGTSGLIVKTSNQGLSWQWLNSGTNQDLYGVHFVNNDVGVIVGNNLSILRTETGGIYTSSYINLGWIPNQFSLAQNYPNPFNPVTRIKYEIPLSRGVSAGRGVLVRLIIYDILGREIETLVNENKKPGTYEVDWDGSRFASGVYFYRLITDDASVPLSITKKMVLMK